jgi:hypothetical protein
MDYLYLPFGLAQLVTNVSLINRTVLGFDHNVNSCTTVLIGLYNKELVKEQHRAMRQAIRRIFRSKNVDKDRWEHYSTTLNSKLPRIPQSEDPETEWNNIASSMCKSAYIALHVTLVGQKIKPIMITKYVESIRILRNVSRKQSPLTNLTDHARGVITGALEENETLKTTLSRITPSWVR